MPVDRVRDMCQAIGKLHAAGRWREAKDLATEAAALCRESLGKGHYAWPLTLCAAAACDMALGETVSARLKLEDAVASARDLQVEDFEHARSVFSHAAETHRELGNHSGARELWLELIQMTGRALGEDHPRYFAERARIATLAGEAWSPSKVRT